MDILGLFRRNDDGSVLRLICVENEHRSADAMWYIRRTCKRRLSINEL
jgi:hypothetical protein